ncbi:hypothetical protein [Streptomyces sp. NPDC001401]|uniref:hypothetical protein n=1 Tax=Streptomyces sp. NPDC001401 TaxID=3364570 RepID=UPI00368D6314
MGVTVAVAAVVAWLAFSAVLLVVANSSSDTTWTRMAWVFGSVQAIAFSAAGALFGTSVQAGRVAHAESRAQAATQKAEQHAEDASKGRAMAAILQAEMPPDTAREDGPSSQLPTAPETDDDAVLETKRRHARLSRALYGDLLGRETDPIGSPTSN